jgi:acyl-CoA hydrolase/RimJ/RimL family protein N-acetyltransferase
MMQHESLAALEARWPAAHRAKIRPLEAALEALDHGQRVFVGSGAAVPQALVRALAERADHLHDLEVVHILTLGSDPTTDPRFDRRVRHANFFIGPNAREAVQQGRADYTPVFLSEIPDLFKTGAVPLDVALIQVSPPDRHGFVSYGVAVDIVKSATEASRRVIAEVNPRMPRTHGDSFLHLDQIDTVVFNDEPVAELEPPTLDPVSLRIGKYVASLIEDGATLQMGIGKIPDATLANLGDKRDLGIHTEMFSDGVLPLIEAGVITNARKTFNRGKLVTSFVMGSRQLYDFVHDNPMVEMRPSQYTNDPFLIARHHNMVAINSALEVDLTGQVCADSIGHRFYSGIGGQVDFIRGAARSPGGKPIIALPSTAKGGTTSRISVALSDGAGVVTTRGDVHYVVTEHGVAYLHGKSIRHRAMALIAIAHPTFRRELFEGAKTRGYLEGDQIMITDRQGAYPLELEETVTLRDGRSLLLRPIRSTDEELLKALFYRQSDESLYYRFFSTRKYLPRKHLQSLAHIDYNHAMAILAVENPGPREEPVGVARYFRERHGGLAEFAILVDDRWHNQGVGTALLTKLVAVARAHGVEGFKAEILADNAHMFDLLEGMGLERTTRVEAGVAHVELLFPRAPAATSGGDPSG